MSKEQTVTDYLTAAVHALRSYQYGNASPDLAEEVADAIEKYLADPHPKGDET